jgi:quinol monooxygenase YgiN
LAEHVSFFKAKVLPGKLQAVVDHMNRWEQDQKPKAKGWIRSYLAASNGNPDELMGVIVWDSTENYFANANRPGQDVWYRELRADLTGDPDWFDATLVREWKA